MAIKINKRELNNSDAIKDNVGFAFILEDNTEGFGFISLAANDNNIVVTVIAMYTNETIDSFSILIDTCDNFNLRASIKDCLEEYFECEVTFIKGYKELKDMNIIVDLEVE